MNPGYCGFFEKPDWVEDSEPVEYLKAIPGRDGEETIFYDEEAVADGGWLSSDRMISLGDVR